MQGQQRGKKDRYLLSNQIWSSHCCAQHTHKHSITLTTLHKIMKKMVHNKNKERLSESRRVWVGEGGEKSLWWRGETFWVGTTFEMCWVICRGGCGGSSLILNKHHAQCLLPESGLRLRGDQLHHHFFACGHIDSSQAVGSDMTAGYVWARPPACFLHRQRRWGWWLRETLWACLVFHRANTHAPIYQINEMKSRW